MKSSNRPPQKSETTKEPLFDLGRVLATPGALEQMAVFEVHAHELLSRHVFGDWGECDAEDATANNEALLRGTRILSVYRLDQIKVGTDHRAKCERHRFTVPPKGTVVWCITEADRSVTTLLLPEEY